jgi:hypothetical protein
MIAALFVETGGSYYNLDGVDPWDQARDARKYDGPYPVVAHPPCQRWGKMWAGSPYAIAKTVRQWGGVLEHPWGSHAWAHFGLNVPSRAGGWTVADDYGWTCCVEQGRYGHYARKPTLLYTVGINPPELEWGISEAKFPPEAIAKYGLARCKRIGELSFKGGGKDNHHRIGTPPEFRSLLLSMAQSAKVTA